MNGATTNKPPLTTSDLDNGNGDLHLNGAGNNWKEMTGLKAKDFTPDELAAFEKPFTLGWTREVVLRSNTSTAIVGRKPLGDVYYHSPDKKIKLRSYVELGTFLKKNPDCGLEPENFTFARQPVYHAPDEIVRNALPRGVSSSDSVPSSPTAKVATVTAVPTIATADKASPKKPAPVTALPPPTAIASSETTAETAAEGRSKRRSKAPARFEDLEFTDPSPLKKKPRVSKTPDGSGSSTPTPPAVPPTKAKEGRARIINTNSMKKKKQEPAAGQTSLLKSNQSAETPTAVKPEPNVAADAAKVETATPVAVSQAPTNEHNSNIANNNTAANFNNQANELKNEDKSEETPVMYTDSMDGVECSDIGHVEEIAAAASETAGSVLDGSELDGSEGHSEQPVGLRPDELDAGAATTEDHPGDSVPAVNGGDAAPPSAAAPGQPNATTTLKAAKIRIRHPKAGGSRPSSLKTYSSALKPIKPKPSRSLDRQMDAHELVAMMHGFSQAGGSSGPLSGEIVGGSTPVPPCSITCIGRHGGLPNSLCSRCLLLFHPECVPGAVYLKDPIQFVCPNCVQPDDMQNSADPSYIEQQLASSSSSNKRSLLAQASGDGPSNLLTPNGGKHFQLIGQKVHAKQIPGKQGLVIRPSKKMGSPHAQVRIHGGSVRKPQQVVQRSGAHLQISSQFNQFNAVNKMLSGSGAAKTLLPQQGCLSNKQHQQMSKLIQNQLQAMYSPPPIAPIAPIKMTPAQIASMLGSPKLAAPAQRRKLRGYKQYIARKFSPMNNLMQGCAFLNKALDKLNVKDLMSLKKVNRTFRNLVSQKFLWSSMRLKGVTIRNWEALGKTIVESNESTELDFDGIRVPSGQDIVEQWKSCSFVDFLKSVKVMKFGTVPSGCIVEIINAAVEQNAYNSFASLEALIVNNVYDETSAQKDCKLDLFGDVHTLEKLHTLKLGCKFGMITSPDNADVLSTIVAGLPNLTRLSLPNLKNFSTEQFSFLTKLTNVTDLEIGSCVSWTTVDGDEPTPAATPNANGSDNEAMDDAEPLPELRGAYKYLGQLVNLTKLKLVEVIIDDTSNCLPLALQRMPNLTHLAFEALTISPDAIDTLDTLSDTIRRHLPELKSIEINSEDSQTNRCIFDLVKRMQKLTKFTWLVGAIVEDTGDCLVPLAKAMDESDLDGEMDLTGGEQSEIIDINLLTELLQKNLPNTQVLIKPQ